MSPGHQSLVARAVLVGLRCYQRWVSPALPRRCRYYPTCSAYAVEAVQVHGVAKGMVLALWRVMRCNPFVRGGVDHVPEPGQWRYRYPRDIPRPESAATTSL
nr:membrane protein insertion efficiency factor YidD [Actinomyces sp.]